MTFEIVATGPLSESFPEGGLYHTWLTGSPVLESADASSDLAHVLSTTATPPSAPLWQNEEFANKLPAALRNMPHGPDVVVTGQQPGYLGGPLLTLFKIATAIELAARRSAAGQPTVPVFWSGDDDDDLAEALAP